MTGVQTCALPIYGDVNYNDVYPKVHKITPVPGGVGPMTVVMLMHNVLEAYEEQRKNA